MAVAFGGIRNEEMAVPALALGITYTFASAGRDHIVLLRSDGTAVAIGDNRHGQCNLPALAPGLSFVPGLAQENLQAFFEQGVMSCLSLGGSVKCKIVLQTTDRLMDLRMQLTRETGFGPSRLDIVLPCGVLLSRALAEQPAALATHFL